MWRLTLEDAVKFVMFFVCFKGVVLNICETKQVDNWSNIYRNIL